MKTKLVDFTKSLIERKSITPLDDGAINVLKKDGVFQRFTYMPEYNIWAHKICHVYKCVATIKKTTLIEKNHRLVFMNKKRATDALYDMGFKYFVQNL